MLFIQILMLIVWSFNLLVNTVNALNGQPYTSWVIPMALFFIAFHIWGITVLTTKNV